MPRGIYDRSKKAQHATDKTGPAVAPKKTPGRRGRKPKSQNITQQSAAQKGDGLQPSMTKNQEAQDRYFNFSAQAEVRNNLSTLNQLAINFPSLKETIESEVSAHLSVMKDLRSQTFAFATPPTAAEEGIDAQSTQTAPMQESSNGVSNFTGSVPLPPTPVQVAPITH